jgi:hypothetical protein
MLKLPGSPRAVRWLMARTSSTATGGSPGSQPSERDGGSSDHLVGKASHGRRYGSGQAFAVVDIAPFSPAEPAGPQADIGGGWASEDRHASRCRLGGPPESGRVASVDCMKN